MNTLKKSLIVLTTCASGILSAAPGERVTNMLADLNKTSEQPNIARMRSGSCFDGSTHVLSIGVGLGSSSYYNFGSGAGYSSGRTPLFVLSYEQSLQNKVGPGYIGLGPYFSFQNAHENYDYRWPYNGAYGNYTRSINWNYFVIALKAAYHWDVLNIDNAELYAGAIAGVRFNTISYKSNNPDPGYIYKETSSGSVYPALGLFIGGRWYFVPTVALYGEAGYGVSWLTIGLSFKF